MDDELPSEEPLLVVLEVLEGVCDPRSVGIGGGRPSAVGFGGRG